jgi:Family of unknown function (DUF695)
MSEDWDFYFCLLRDMRASIFVNLSIASVAPIPGQDHMAYVRVFMCNPRDDGLSSDEEFDALSSVQNSLEREISEDLTSTYVGRVTSSGYRDFYFYTSDPSMFPVPASEAMSAHPAYEFEVGYKPDAEWNTFFKFLYPSPDELQSIMKRRAH